MDEAERAATEAAEARQEDPDRPRKIARANEFKAAAEVPNRVCRIHLGIRSKDSLEPDGRGAFFCRRTTCMPLDPGDYPSFSHPEHENRSS